MHNKAIINAFCFVTNGENLNYWQTFLESTLIFAKKCTLYRGKGAYDIVNRNFTIGRGPFAEKSPFSVKSKNFLVGYLRFEEKMYVVI